MHSFDTFLSKQIIWEWVGSKQMTYFGNVQPFWNTKIFGVILKHKNTTKMQYRMILSTQE